MKKIILVLMAVLFAFTIAWAAGTVTETSYPVGNFANNYRVTVFSWTAATNGTVSAHISSVKFTGMLYMVVTDPDTSSAGAGPSDNYDITITNKEGIDIMGGALANRDSTSSEAAIPLFTTGVYFSPVVNDSLTINISGNSVNAAKGQIKLLWEQK